MRLSLSAATLALLTSVPAYATLVVFQWTPERILLAADSLATRIHGDGRLEQVTQCKIHQQGDIFFSIVGINDDPAAGVDLVSLASRAAAGSRNLRGVVHSFEVLAGDSVPRLWDDMVNRHMAAARVATETDGRMSLTLIFVSRKEHAVAVKEYSGTGSGGVIQSPARLYGSTSGMRRDTKYVAVGVYADAEAASATNRIAGLEGVAFLNSFFQVQIAHELERARWHGQPRIGGPVCILQIMAGGAAGWINGQQGPCPNVRP